MIKHFRDLDVYLKSQEFYPRVIEFTKEFSQEGNHINDAINAGFGNNNLGKVLFEEYERLGKQLYRLREKWKKF